MRLLDDEGEIEEVLDRLRVREGVDDEFIEVDGLAVGVGRDLLERVFQLREKGKSFDSISATSRAIKKHGRTLKVESSVPSTALADATCWTSSGRVFGIFFCLAFLTVVRTLCSMARGPRLAQGCQASALHPRREGKGD